MCGFDKDYLKDSCPAKHQGSQKLLHWSAKDVSQWVCGIELDGYATALDKMGIHGAIMVSKLESEILILLLSYAVVGCQLQ